jgi:Leucine-rich repeat (LRR) protein
MLGLSGNKLSGEIPDSIGDCMVLQELGLDNNLFEGKIPQSLEKLKGLSPLNLSVNKLSGTIPEGIGSIRDLQQLYLAHNNLSGTMLTVNSCIKVRLDLQADKSSVAVKGPFFPRVVNPRYRIRGTNV